MLLCVYGQTHRLPEGHGCMVHTERAETAAISRGTSHVTVESLAIRVTCDKSAVSARERYIKAINNNLTVCQPDIRGHEAPHHHHQPNST